MTPYELQQLINSIDMLIGIALSLGCFLGFILHDVFLGSHLAYRLWRKVRRARKCNASNK